MPSAPARPCGCSPRVLTLPRVRRPSRSSHCSAWRCSSSWPVSRARPSSTSPPTGPHWHRTPPRALAGSPRVVGGGYAVVVAAAATHQRRAPFGVGIASLMVLAVLVLGAAVALSLRAIALDDPEVHRRPASTRRASRRPPPWSAPRHLGAGRAAPRRPGGGRRPPPALVERGVHDLRPGGCRRVRRSGPPSVAQVLALPNPGALGGVLRRRTRVQVVEGSATTWSGPRAAQVLMVPVLVALPPQPGAFPWFAPLSALGVMVVGGLVARRALGEVARLSRVRTKPHAGPAPRPRSSLGALRPPGRGSPPVPARPGRGARRVAHHRAAGRAAGRCCSRRPARRMVAAPMIMDPPSGSGGTTRPRGARLGLRHPSAGLFDAATAAGAIVPGARRGRRPRRYRRTAAGRAPRHPHVRLPGPGLP